MTAALFRKELRGALPLALLWWLVWGMSTVEHAVVEPADLATFRELLEAFGTDTGTIVFGSILCLWLSAVLLPGEHSSGTVEFLDSLPTTRTHVFLVKAATGLAVVWSGPVLQTLLAWTIAGAARPSVDPAPPATIVLPWLALTGAELTILFCLSLLLSLLHRFQWLAAVLLVLTYLMLKARIPALTVLDPSTISEPVVVGRGLAIPWTPLLVQSGVAAVSLVAAWLLFCGAGDRIAGFVQRNSSTAFGKIAFGAVTVLAVALWIVVPIVMVSNDREDEDSGDEHRVIYVGSTTSHAATAHYTFSFPTGVARRGAELLAVADSIHERVRTYFGADPLPPIDVDGNAAGPALYAGRAFHKALQIDIPGAESDADLAAVLAHETTHVYIDAVSNDRLLGIFEWARALHEGLASYVEHRFFRTPAELDTSRTTAALAHAWRRIELEDLIDDAALAKTRDPMLVYAAGEALLASFVDVHGDDAPARLLRGFGRPDHPQTIGGIDLWRDAAQAAGLDLEAVRTRFGALLDDEVRRHRELIDSLPRPRGQVIESKSEDGTAWVGFTPVLDRALPDGWEVRVRVRASPADGPEAWLDTEQRAGTHWVLRSELPGRRVGYSVGLLRRADRAHAFSDWAEATLSR